MINASAKYKFFTAALAKHLSEAELLHGLSLPELS